MNSTKAILEAVARTVAKHAQFDSSVASMLLCDLATDLRNFMSAEEVNDLFTMYQRAKTFNERGTP